MRNRLRAILIGVGSLVDLDGRATQRRMAQLCNAEGGITYFCATCCAAGTPRAKVQLGNGSVCRTVRGGGSTIDKVLVRRKD